MRSVTNIQKITKAMKMVAASKMRVAQASTEQSRGLVEPFLRLLGDAPGELWWSL
jgi:F-type H+-transporting ATPase subunit gamma